MATSSRSVQSALQAVLAIAIVGLMYFLYVSITAPYEAVERRKAITEQTRTRMNVVRTAMIEYQRRNGRYITALDSLVMWLSTDSVMVAGADSILGMSVVVDSLPFSPRTGHAFELALNDTSRVHTYLLSDPDSNDYIGTLSGDVTQLNAASWE